MQSQGLKVMPTMSWSSIESFDFCFDGHEKGGAVIVSTIGTLGTNVAQCSSDLDLKK